MAIIPLEQKVTITTSQGLDSWGQPILGTSTTYDCRIVEMKNLVNNNNGQEDVPSLKIFLDGIVKISFNDLISYTNSLNETITAKPTQVKYINDFGIQMTVVMI